MVNKIELDKPYEPTFEVKTNSFLGRRCIDKAFKQDAGGTETRESYKHSIPHKDHFSLDYFKAQKL